MPLAHFAGPKGFTCHICHTYVDCISKAILYQSGTIEANFICKSCHNVKQRKEKLIKINKS